MGYKGEKESKRGIWIKILIIFYSDDEVGRQTAVNYNKGIF